MEEEPEICRVCRSEATPTQPLFHPCRCSGSIKYVHQDCLLEWLEHSNKRYCELCKHNFAFTPIYAPDMPDSIPRGVLISRAIEKLAAGIRIILRAILVATIWLVLLPYFSVWIWRLYFWIGESFAFKANGLESPAWNSTSFFASRNNITLLASGNHTLGENYNGTSSVESSIMHFIVRTFPEKHQWISKFILDCFEGQIISSVVVVVFVAMFLLQEWVIQNADLDADRRVDGMMEDPELIQAPVANLADEEPIDEAADQQAEQDAGRGRFNMEHAMERLIAAQHQIQAMMDGETDVEDEEQQPVVPEQAATTASHAATTTRGSATAGPSALHRQWSSGVAFENTTNAPDEVQRRPSQGGVFGGIEPSSSSLATGSSTRNTLYYDAATNSLRLARSSSSGPLGSQANNSGEGSSSGQHQQQLNTDGLDVIRSKSGRLFYWDEDETLPLTRQNVFVNRDGTDMTLNQQLAKYDELLKTGDLAFSEVRSLPMKWRTSQLFAQASFSTNPAAEGASSPTFATTSSAAAAPSAAPFNTTSAENTNAKGPTVAMSGTFDLAEATEAADAGVQQLLRDREALLRDRDALQRRQAHLFAQQMGRERERALMAVREAALERAGHRARDQAGVPIRAPIAPAPAPAQAQQPQPVEPVRAGGVRPPFDDPLRAEPDDDFDEMGAEELHGILEVIGMHGSYWILLQNSLLMSALICATLGLGVWIPFMIGKTTLLMNPFNVLRLPLHLLSRLMDPITDFIIDRVMPSIMLVTRKAASIVSQQIGPIIKPYVARFLGGEAFQPFTDAAKEYALSLWEALLNVAAVGIGMAPNTTTTPNVIVESVAIASDVATAGTTLLAESISSTASAAPTTGTVITPTMVLQHVMKRWTEIAYGSTSNDKSIAIAVGYVILFLIASWYMAQTRNVYGQTLSRVLRDIIRQQGMILKIAFFVAIEMVVFPLFCGALISLSTLPVFKGATLASRFAFYMQAPNWSIIMHWIVGTAFMFNFSMFVGACRGMVRPGVMWFIRDPNDPGFHPIREILERPITMQLRKLGTGALMYMVLIVGGIAATCYSISFFLPGVFPLRLPVDRPLSDIPLDLLLFWLGPNLVRTLAISERVKKLFEVWWRKMSHVLRLSSFMYGKRGERYPSEEGHFEYRTWRAWLLQWRPDIPDIHQTVEEVTAAGAEVVFVRDGGLYRVPNTDRILHLKDRRVLVPVDDEGNALDPVEDLPGEVDPTMDGQFHIRGVQRPPQDPKQGTVVVYGPPNFKRRLLAFVILLWASVMAFCAATILLPIMTGRLFTVWYLGIDTLHDSITFTSGACILGGGWVLLDRLATAINFLMTPEADGIHEQQQMGQGPLNYFIRAKAQAVGRLLWDYAKLGARLAYFSATLGVMVPLMTTLVLELYIFLPLRRLLTEEPGINLFLDWAFAFTFIRTVLHTMFLMQEVGLMAAPETGFMVDVNRLLVTPRILDWNVEAITKQLIVPFATVATASLVAPSALAWILTTVVSMEEWKKAWVFRLIHPITMFVFLIVFGTRQSYQVISRWSQYVRDEEYLLGRQLHNLEEDEVEVAEDGVPAATAATEGEDVVDTHTVATGDAHEDRDPTTGSTFNTFWARIKTEDNDGSDEEQQRTHHTRDAAPSHSFPRHYVQHSGRPPRPTPQDHIRVADTPLRRRFTEQFEDPELDISSDSDDDDNTLATRGKSKATTTDTVELADPREQVRAAFLRRLGVQTTTSRFEKDNADDDEDESEDEEEEQEEHEEEVETLYQQHEVTAEHSNTFRDKGKGKKTDDVASDVWAGMKFPTPSTKRSIATEEMEILRSAVDEDDVEGDSIAARTRLRRSQRLQALGSRRSSSSSSTSFGH